MSDDDLYAHVTVEEWVRRTARRAESASDDVKRFRDATPQERFDAMCVIQATAALVTGNRPLRRLGDEADFWRRWMDPNVGRPR